MFFQADLGRVDISDVCRDHNEYSALSVNLEPASGVDLSTMFDHDLWCQAGDAVKLSKESLNAARALVKEIGCVVPYSKNGYVDLVQ